MTTPRAFSRTTQLILACVLCLFSASAGARQAAPKAHESAPKAKPVEVQTADDGHAEDHAGADELPKELQGYVPGADRLEGRIMAPCCWLQTLDIHHSPIATELKRDIRTRLAAGESADAIEASLVKRYGERILAVPDDSPLKGIAVLLSFIMGGAGIFAMTLLVRWRRRTARSASTADPEEAEPTHDEWDERLDRELSKLEN